jgi:hypothetical protein
MKALRSITGAAFAALYAIAFVAVYVDYRNHLGQWLADLGLILIALPFVLTMRFLSGGSYDMSGDDSLKLVAAAIFCCALAYIAGAALGWLVRAAFRRLRGRPAP